MALLARDVEAMISLSTRARDAGEVLMAIELLETARGYADTRSSWTLRTSIEADLSHLREECEGAASPLSLPPLLLALVTGAWSSW